MLQARRAPTKSSRSSGGNPAPQVLGDRSLKVKHLTPHALLVASGAAPDSSPNGDPNTLHLHVEILDAVTGRALFRQVHQVSEMGKGRSQGEERTGKKTTIAALFRQVCRASSRHKKERKGEKRKAATSCAAFCTWTPLHVPLRLSG